MQPQVGDEVITSGLDGIFFEGIKVGVVTEVIEEESSKTVIVKPYSTHYIPSYMHVIYGAVMMNPEPLEVLG